jgi:heme/copper-type cytochrome/quinol oxidase subunit 2
MIGCVEELQQQAGVFKKNAHDLKNKMWWKNMKLWLVIGLIVVIIIAIIVGVAVSQSQAAKSSSGN